jgi:hypothetical protein
MLTMLKGGLGEKFKSAVGGFGGSHHSIAIVRRAIKNQPSTDTSSLADALNDIVENRLWSEVRDAMGMPFDSFASLALAPSPHGLNVANQAAARLVRQSLLDNKHYSEWTELIKVCRRKPGNTRNNANRERSRFYTVGRSTTCVDRLLLTLEEKYPDIFARVCAGELSPRHAAIQAGIISAKPVKQVGFRDILHSAKHMKPKAQVRLLQLLFDEMSLDAQCALIANSIEVGLGSPGLAKKWRETHSNPTTVRGDDRQH